jgi:hypothetical protein
MSTGPLTPDLSVGFYGTGQESPEGWKCILYCYSIDLKKLLLFGSVAPDPDQFDIMVRQWVTANGYPAHLNYDQTEITGHMLDAILLAANIPIERSVPSWCNHEKFQALLTAAIAFSATLSGDATGWSFHLSTLISQSMQVMCNRDLWKRVATTNRELNVVVQEEAAEEADLGGLSGVTVTDGIVGSASLDVASEKENACCVVPVTVDKSTELCEDPGPALASVDLNLEITSTADVDLSTVTGIAPREFNSGSHMVDIARTVSTQDRKRKGNWDWVYFDNEEWANNVNRAICISRNPDQHPIGSTSEDRIRKNKEKEERWRKRGNLDKGISDPPEDAVANSSSTTAGSGSGSGSSNSVQAAIELSKFRKSFRNSQYAAVIQSGWSVLVYAPCILGEDSVRHVELGELASQGAKIVYAVNLHELDSEIKRWQPAIVDTVRYRSMAPTIDSDRHHRKMEYKIVVLERIITQHGSVHYLGPAIYGSTCWPDWGLDTLLPDEYLTPHYWNNDIWIECESLPVAIKYLEMYGAQPSMELYGELNGAQTMEVLQRQLVESGRIHCLYTQGTDIKVKMDPTGAVLPYYEVDQDPTIYRSFLHLRATHLDRPHTPIALCEVEQFRF